MRLHATSLSKFGVLVTVGAAQIAELRNLDDEIDGRIRRRREWLRAHVPFS
jgi:hypothetical protein